MERGSLKCEFLSFFQPRGKSPSASALNQVRSKLPTYAMKSVFHIFNSEVSFLKPFRCFHFLACDGSALNITRNPDDTDDALNSSTTGYSCLGYNILHLNALYDLMERRYVDAALQPVRKKNEFRPYAK